MSPGLPRRQGSKEEPLEAAWRSEREREIAAIVAREPGNLKHLIRKWVPDASDVVRDLVAAWTKVMNRDRFDLG